MDILQLLIGIIFLLSGSFFSYRSRDNRRLFFGLILIIIGIALVMGGFGFKI